jgi:hypothetical protein
LVTERVNAERRFASVTVSIRRITTLSISLITITKMRNLRDMAEALPDLNIRGFMFEPDGRHGISLTCPGSTNARGSCDGDGRHGIEAPHWTVSAKSGRSRTVTR